jgi:hypothetical protein
LRQSAFECQSWRPQAGRRHAAFFFFFFLGSFFF